MKEVKLYAALVGVVVIIASVALFQALFTSGDNSGPKAPEANAEVSQNSENGAGKEMEMTEEEQEVADVAMAWVEAFFQTDLAEQQYLANLEALSTPEFGEVIKRHFSYHVEVGEENELLLEARMSNENGVKYEVEITEPMVNIEGMQAGFSCRILAHYDLDDSYYQVGLLLYKVEEGWRVADVMRRYL